MGVNKTPIPLLLHEWLELGQAVTKNKYFKKDDMKVILIKTKCYVRAGGIKYGPGRYYLNERMLPR